MGKKKKRHGFGGQIPHSQSTPIYRRKRTPGWIKALVAVLFIGVVGAVGVWQFSPKESSLQPSLQPSPQPSPQPPPPQQAYPTYASGVFYNNPTATEGGTKIQLPYDFVKDKKIVFTDVKLANKTNELQYQGRSIPLSLYKNGNYLPLIAIHTPLGNIKAGIRTCEPCGSFSMHIGEGKYLICDSCGTKWNLETFKGVSGGCPQYPPPQLPTTIKDNIEIDLTTLGIAVIG